MASSEAATDRSDESHLTGRQWKWTVLAIFLVISGVVGLLFVPNTAGKPLEEIEAERSDDRAPTPEAVS